MKKKFKKLIKNPKLFFTDMLLKRSMKIKQHIPKKMIGYQQYTVISAVYNVSAYLEEYFSSLINQRLDFKNNIHLIMVDDGSIDNSAQIIKRWQKRFPANITYVYQENGGQASARNTGLEYIKTEWVTFIDPDDFLDLDYFLEIDALLKKQQDKKIEMIGCNFIFYHEDKKQFADNHPLKFRFAKGDIVLPSNDLGKHIQLSAATAFFKKDIIDQNLLRFDTQIRPNFEDAHFVGVYLKHLQKADVAFSSKAKYFYRKRSDGTSTLDTSWGHEGRYSSVFIHGYIQILERYYIDYGFVPSHIQRTVLYDLIWYLKVLINKPEVVAFLSDADRNNFVNHFEHALTFIEPETILSFELAGCWLFHKVGLIESFKQEKLPFQIVYIEDYDPIKSQVQLRYFTSEIGFEKFAVDGEDVFPHFAKTMNHDFLERTFVCERRIWLPLSQINQNQTLTAQIGVHDARITLAGKQHTSGLKTDDIKKHFKSKQVKHKIEPHFAGAWLFLDRDTQADDNAEHLYRYVQANYPEQNIFFVLRDDSHDWARLEKSGFNLLAYSSAEHESALRSCSKIISSHADQFVTDYFKDGSLNDKQFIFLQHGVIKDDLSAWLNTKHKIDYFVTSAKAELESISGNDNRYKYTKKEVNLTGLPRHDGLINSTIATEKLIVIMPTWRKSLLGKRLGDGSKSELIGDFMASEYAQRWQSFLQNPKFKQLVEVSGYRVIFFPHVNMQVYLSEFDVPSHIEILPHTNSSIQELFLKMTLLITDFSSVAFEAAILNKTSLYYQFDEKEFFNSSCNYQKGYFDYRANGFGPVVTQEAELIDALTHLLEQDAKPDLVYQTRMAEFFPFRDGRNCERVYDAILALDQPMPDDFIDIEILKNAAENAYKAGQWESAQSRLEQYIALQNTENKVDVLMERFALGIALRHQGKFLSLNTHIAALESELPADHAIRDLLKLEQFKHSVQNEEWAKAILEWQALNFNDQNDQNDQCTINHILLCLAELDVIESDLQYIWQSLLSVCTPIIRNIILAYQTKNWLEVIEIAHSDIDNVIGIHDFASFWIMRAQCAIGEFKQAKNTLNIFEKTSVHKQLCHRERARIDYKEGIHLKSVFAHLKNAYPEGIITYAQADFEMLIHTHILLGDYDSGLKALKLFESEGLRQFNLSKLKIMLSQNLRREEGKLQSSSELINQIQIDFPKDYMHLSLLRIELFKLNVQKQDWQAANQILPMLSTLTEAERVCHKDLPNKILYCLAEQKLETKALQESWKFILDSCDQVVRDTAQAYQQNNWAEVLKIAKDNSEKILDEHEFAPLWVIRAQCAMGEFTQAKNTLNVFEKVSAHKQLCHRERARIDYKEGIHLKSVLVHLKNAYPEGITAMSLTDASMQLHTHRLLNDLVQLEHDLNALEELKNPQYHALIQQEKSELVWLKRDWAQVVLYYSELKVVSPQYFYQLAFAHRQLGDIKEALNILKNVPALHIHSSEELLLMAELALLQEEYALSANTWNTLLRLYPNEAPNYAWERLQFARTMEKLNARAS